MRPRLRALSPTSIRPPFARYSHAVEVAEGARLLVLSGQLGIGPDDIAPDDAEAQATLCFANIAAILEEGAMTAENVVRLNAYVTGREHFAGYMTARDAFVADLSVTPASTLMIVGGFTRPEFVMEVEALAAA